MLRLLRRPALVLVVVTSGMMLVGASEPAMASPSGMAASRLRPIGGPAALVAVSLPNGSRHAASGGVAAQADTDGLCRDALMFHAYEPIAHAWSSGAEVPFSQCAVVSLSTANQNRALPTFALLTGLGRALE